MEADAEDGNEAWGGETAVVTSEEPVSGSDEVVEAEATAFDEVRRPAKLLHHADVFFLFLFFSRPQRVS